MSLFQTIIKGQNEHATRYQIQQKETLLSFRNVLDLWQDSAAFRDFYLSILTELTYEDYYWEHPALRVDLLDKPYEFVLLSSGGFKHRQVDTQSFSAYFETDRLVVDFPNLGKNAHLIVPTPHAKVDYYKHLAIFVRQAPPQQVEQFFKDIGRLTLEHLSVDKYLWLNTAGMGVIWLHIRLDSRPKYYKTRVYKQEGYLNTL